MSLSCLECGTWLYGRVRSDQLCGDCAVKAWPVCTHCGRSREELPKSSKILGEGSCTSCRARIRLQAGVSPKPSSQQNLEYQRRWREKDPARAVASDVKRFTKYYGTLRGRSTYLLNGASTRARRAGVEYDLDVLWLRPKLEAGICEVTGLPFKIEVGNGKGHRVNSFSPSIDRIDQTGGYVKVNCRLTCWIYNRARGAFPSEDFDLMVASLKAKK